MSMSTPTTPGATHQLPGVQQKPHSCVLCAQRKVKCDKKIPCANCVKARLECIPGVPTRPRRRKRREGEEEDLVSRLRRYERMLLAYGATREELDSGTSASRSASVDPTSSSGVRDSKLSQLSAAEAPVHSNIWHSLSDEILEGSSDDELLGQISQNVFPDGGSMIFDVRPSDSELNSLHPNPIQILQLWQTFVDNVNPLVKIFHIPTLQQHILIASGNVASIPKEMGALMFSIYACAITSMNEESCQGLMGEEKSILLTRYNAITQQALMNARLLTTSNIVVLQAFLLYLLSVRTSYDLQAIWILTGMAVRIGQRFGLHSERLLAKCSVFEAEQRRRLWWQILLIEGRAAEVAGISTAVQANTFDTEIPRNLNDADLYPSMLQLPPSHELPTEMLFCLLRYEVGEFIRNSGAMNGGWQMLMKPDLPLADKEAVVKELEDLIQEKYFKYFDPVIPLHFLCFGVEKSVIGRMRLMCRHPRQYPDRGASMRQSDKDELFDICLMMIGWDNKGHSTQGIQGYMWHINFQFQCDAFIWCLSELRYHSMGSRADEAWQQILEVYDHHNDILVATTNALYVAVNSLALKAWNAREASFAALGQFPPEGAPPRAIAVLRSQRVSLATRTAVSQPLHGISGTVPTIPQFYGNNNFVGDDISFDPSLTPIDVGTTMDTSPVDWAYWNDLIRGNELAMPDVNDVQTYNQMWDYS